MTLRPEGETLARELTLGALSYADLARRVRMLAERLFTRRLPFLQMVVVDPDRPDFLLIVTPRDGPPSDLPSGASAAGIHPAAHNGLSATGAAGHAPASAFPPSSASASNSASSSAAASPAALSSAAPAFPAAILPAAAPAPLATPSATIPPAPPAVAPSTPASLSAPFPATTTVQAGASEVVAHAVRLDEPVLFGPDVAAECRSRGIAPPDTITQSLLLIPLAREGKKLGALVLGLDLAPGTEITRRWAALSGATQVVAAVLQSCREHEKSLADRLDLDKIARAAERLQVRSSLADICALAARILVDEFEFDRSLLLLRSDDGRRLAGVAAVGYEDICQLIRLPIVAGRGVPAHADSGIPSSLHSTPHAIPQPGPRPDALTEVFCTGVPWMTREAGDHLRIPVILRESGEIHEGVALPLRVGGESIGVLWADHRRPRGRLTASRLAFLNLYAAHAAAAADASDLRGRVDALAGSDPLTGVANRLRLEGVLAREIGRVRRNKNALSLLLVDIDRFRALNSRYGHEYGDTVLRDVAALLTDTMRATDLVARLGGDEFVVLMPDTTEEQARNAQRRLESALADYNARRDDVAVEDGRPALSLSLGLRSAGPDAVETILDDADRNMNEARDDRARSRLLEALITNHRDEVVLRDNFVANSLKVLYDKEAHFLDHSRRVMQLVLTLARLAELPERDRIAIGLAALLHDIGKISISTELLNRPGPLAEEERATVRAHCALGEELLRGHAYLAPVKTILHSHHERFDGRTDGPYPGYPDGLAGEAIPLGARIVKIADCYDAMTSWRPYQAARPSSVAVAILREERGKSFDPALLDLFLAYLQPHLATRSPGTPSPRGETEEGVDSQ